MTIVDRTVRLLRTRGRNAAKSDASRRDGFSAYLAKGVRAL